MVLGRGKVMEGSNALLVTLLPISYMVQPQSTPEPEPSLSWHTAALAAMPDSCTNTIDINTTRKNAKSK